MQELRDSLAPITRTELAELLNTEPEQKFIRESTCNTTGARSLYGQLLHLRGIPDQVLVKLPGQKAQEAAFLNVEGDTPFMHALIDYPYRHTSTSRSDLIIGRASAALVDPKLLLGPNAEIITTLGELPRFFTGDRTPGIREINWHGKEATAAYSRALKGWIGYPTEEQFLPIWYAHHPIKTVYQAFGEELARTMALAANEIQLLPELPLDPRQDKSMLRKMAEDAITVITAHEKLYFLDQLVLQNGAEVTMTDLVRITNLRLRRYPPPSQIDHKMKVFSHETNRSTHTAPPAI